MFNPTMILAAIAFVAVTLTGGFLTGYEWAGTRHKAAQAEQLIAHNKAVGKLQAHADELSHALSIAEGRVIHTTVEVIKYVDKYTTGKPCLDAAAVGVLQPGSSPGLRPPTGQHATEGTGAAASDRDVYLWIGQANYHYETCALRLNALINFTNMSNPLPEP